MFQRILFSSSLLFFAVGANHNGGDDDDDFACRPFHQIYENGKNLCETMWDGAFTVDESGHSENTSYTMGPNDAISELLGKSFIYDGAGDKKCQLEYYHLNYTTTQTLGEYKACHYYSEESCCKSTTLTGFDSMNELYGPEYHIDRCGPLSDACKYYFLMESCLYECDPNAGLFRKFTDAQVHADIKANGSETWTNTWQMEGMPIKKAFCDNWYAACYDDLFCSVNNGSFFSCAKQYDAPEDNYKKKYRDEKKWTDQLTIITVVVTVVGLFLLGALIFVLLRDRSGWFAPLKEDGIGMENVATTGQANI